MSHVRNNYPRRVFWLSGKISGCAIDFVDGTQCKSWYVILGFTMSLPGDLLLPILNNWKLSTAHTAQPLEE